ncbi:MAG TPA: cysteine-rich CWC family protein [Verrucomicrobiae bacterium]|nr:cysteine-rich CWC family protein [Verrucomicrobiae bacterium]
MPTDIDPARCPLCGGLNDCRLCTSAAYKGPCWCESVNIPPELLAHVPEEARQRACLCRNCVMAFHREQSTTGPLAVAAGDYYFDTDGLMVFTAAYHLRRGYCCGNDCRHCPYEVAK